MTSEKLHDLQSLIEKYFEKEPHMLDERVLDLTLRIKYRCEMHLGITMLHYLEKRVPTI